MPRITGPGSTPVASTQPREAPKNDAQTLAEKLSWNAPVSNVPADLTVTAFRDGAASRGGVNLGPMSGAPGAQLANAGQRVRLPEPVVLRSDADGRTYTAHASIPLEQLDLAPLSADEFLAQVNGAELLPPWGKDGGRARVTVNGDRLDIDAAVGAPGAFSVRPPIVFLKLANGQDVSLTLTNPQVGRDDTALLRARTERSIEAVNTALKYDQQNVDAAAADPAALERALAVKTQHEAELAQLTQQLDAVNAGIDTIEYKATAYP